MKQQARPPCLHSWGKGWRSGSSDKLMGNYQPYIPNKWPVYKNADLYLEFLLLKTCIALNSVYRGTRLMRLRKRVGNSRKLRLYFHTRWMHTTCGGGPLCQDEVTLNRSVSGHLLGSGGRVRPIHLGRKQRDCNQLARLWHAWARVVFIRVEQKNKKKQQSSQ